MKRKIRKTLSPLQQRRLIKIALLVLVLAASWLLFAPNVGIVSLYKQKAHLQSLESQSLRLEKENAVLRLEIDRIHNDIDYFEYLAREKHGLVKENEIIFDFSKDRNKKKKN